MSGQREAADRGWGVLHFELTCAEGEDVVLPDLAPGQLQASIDEVLVGLRRRAASVRAALSGDLP